MSLTEKFIKRNPQCAFRVIDNQALVVKVSADEGNRVYSLNSTGTLIWELADGTTKLSDIASAAKVKFEVTDDEMLLADLDEFVEDMAGRDLLEVSEQPL